MRNTSLLSTVLLAAFVVLLSSRCDAKPAAKLAIASIEASTVQQSDLPEGVADLSAKNIIDGDSNTRWGSEWSDNNWLLFELKNKSLLKKITVSWETAKARTYRIMVSKDKKKWTQVYSTENCPGGNEEIALEKSVQAKYVRFDLIKRDTDWGFSIIDVSFEGK